MNSLKTYLTEAYAIDDKSILRILTQNKQINKADPDYSYYEKLANWANSSGKQQKLKNIDLNTIQLSDKGLIEKRKLTTRYTTLGHVLLALKNLMDQEGKYTPSSELSRLTQQTTLEILAGLSGIKDNKSLPEESNDVKDDEDDIDEEPGEEPENDNRVDGEELRKGMDWTAEKVRRLANAKEPTSEVLSKFYNDYYKIEYAGLKSSDAEDAIVMKLKSLDKILVQEFTKLGYNPEVNPLAQFLKILIKLKKENNVAIFDKLTINTYGAIHNSFKDGVLKGNTLGSYDDKHILFCEDLYNYKGLSIVKYLQLFKNTLDKAEHAKVLPEQDKWVLTNKIFIQQDLADSGEPSDISFKSKVNMLLNKQEGVKFPTDKNAKLRSFAEIEELYTYLFKAAPTTEKPKENEAIKAIIANVKAKNAALDMVYYLTTLKEFKKAYDTADIEKIEANLKSRQYKADSTLINYSKQAWELLKAQINTKKDFSLLVKSLFRLYDNNNKKAGK